jgi:hypothetical protein
MKRMLNRGMGLGLLLVLSGFAGACATGHSIHHGILMKGSVVDQDANGPIVCIGSKDGAEVGQVLTVFRHEKQPNPKSLAPISRKEMGRVEVVKIFDEHYAQVKILSGKAMNGDSVELHD